MEKMFSRILLACALASPAFIYSPVLASMRNGSDTSAAASLAPSTRITNAPKALGAATTLSISGNVKSDGANLSGAVVSLTGGQTASVSTGTDGNYSFTVPAGADYTVTVSKNGIVFSPPSQTVANLQADKLANFPNGATLCIPPSSGLLAWHKGENNADDAAGSGGICSDAVFTNLNPNGKIAFSSNRTGNWEIFVMNADGSDQTNLTNSAALDFDSAFSPDGSKIAFTSHLRNDEIYVMNADGSNQTRLTTDAVNNNVPSWSPDGTKIVFSSQRTGYGDIYVMNSDGTNQIRLTAHIAVDYAPKFSPDGSRIVFYSNRDGNYEIYVMNADGSNQTRLTNNPADDGFPAFSPDGSEIAFTTNRDGNYEIFVMNDDGSNPVNLTNNSAGDYYPAWSLDGSKIAFETNRDDGKADIYVMNADGTNPTRLTNNPTIDSRPTRQTVGNSVKIAPASNVNITFGNVTQAGYTVASPLTATQLPALPVGYSLISPVTAYDIRTSAVYSGSITVTSEVPNVAHSQICDRLRSLHFDKGNWTADNNTAPVYNVTTKICTVSQTVSSLSPFVVAQMTAPTAASVSVGGRVLTAEGRGIRNARVTLTNSAGETRTMLTSAFGYYRFTGIPVGETYVISVATKRFTFAPPVQTLTLQEEQNDVNFTAYN